MTVVVGKAICKQLAEQGWFVPFFQEEERVQVIKRKSREIWTCSGQTASIYWA